MQRTAALVVIAAIWAAAGAAWAQAPSSITPRPAKAEWPDPNRPPPEDGVPKSAGPLAFISLERLRYGSFGRDKKGPYAEIIMPDGKTTRLYQGKNAGKDFGEVTRITRERVELREIIQLWNEDWVKNEAVIERKPDPRSSAQWQLLMGKGERAERAGDRKRALAAYEQAWLFAKRLGARDPRVAESLTRQANVLLANGQVVNAADCLEAALRVRRNAFEVDEAKVAAVKTRLLDLYKQYKAPPARAAALNRPEP